jgi:hypothetical protein
MHEGVIDLQAGYWVKSDAHILAVCIFDEKKTLRGEIQTPSQMGPTGSRVAASRYVLTGDHDAPI